MSFEPITTQEQLDEIIGGRLQRAKEKAIEETKALFADYDTIKTRNEELEKDAKDKEAKLIDLTDKNSQLDARVKKYEIDSVKTKITLETGLPIEFADRLTGTTEDEIRKDASLIAGLLKPSNKAPIGAAENPIGGNDSNKGLREMLGNLKGE